MKRIRLLVLAGVLAAALPVGHDDRRRDRWQ